MINLNFLGVSVLGGVQVLMGIIYLIFFLLIYHPKTIISMVELFVVGIGLILSGLIIFYQGWRLDFLLGMAIFLMTIIIIYFPSKQIYDFIVSQSGSTRD